MTEINFRSLQDLHEGLLQKQSGLSEENKKDFAKEVKEYIEQAKRGGSYISSARERDQLRANLRYWANYVYSVEGTFPDIELAPSAVESKPFSATLIGIPAILVLAIAVTVGGILMFNRINSPAATQVPVVTPTSVQPMETAEPINLTATVVSSLTATETPTPESGGFNVILSSPANGEFITPNVEFKGAFDNLRPGWAIHVLFIDGGKYFPVKENYAIPDKPTSNEWTIQTQLTESPEEMSKAQSYSVVLAVSINDSARELLSNSSKTGIEINSLPDTVLPFDNTARVIYRDPFRVVRETRLLYSLHDGLSYDIYASKTDGSDPIRITSTTDIHERDPGFSPDGKHIVYVKYFIATNTFAIHVMDSNGDNDHEVINSGRNVLENPQWSPDSSYISYTMGETRGSSNRVYWSIHSYNLVTKEDTNISGPPQVQVNRYSSWIPNTNILVFDAAISDRTRLLQAPIDSQDHSIYFDPNQYVSQPNISTLGNGYLLTYAVIGPAPNYIHDIYAALDPEGQDSFDGTPILLIRSGGEVVDYPQVDPDSNTLYYTRNGAIRRVEFQVDGSQITLIRRANTSASGELVIAAGPTREAIHFDVNFIDTFFPIQ